MSSARNRLSSGERRSRRLICGPERFEQRKDTPVIISSNRSTSQYLPKSHVRVWSRLSSALRKAQQNDGLRCLVDRPSSSIATK